MQKLPHRMTLLVYNKPVTVIRTRMFMNNPRKYDGYNNKPLEIVAMLTIRRHGRTRMSRTNPLLHRYTYYCRFKCNYLEQLKCLQQMSLLTPHIPRKRFGDTSKCQRYEKNHILWC